MILCFHQMIPRLTSLDIVISSAVLSILMILHISRQLKKLAANYLKMSCRYNPGGIFKISNDIMDNPGDAKYGMTTEQIYEAFRILKEKGVEEFGIHSFLCSNTVTNEYYPMLAKLLLNLLQTLKLSLVYILPLSTSQAVSEFLTNPIKNLMIFSLLVRA